MALGIATGVALLAAQAGVAAPSSVATSGAAQAPIAGATAPVDARAASDWVARLGDEPIPRRPAEALLRLARREQPELGLAELTRHVALDLLLGDAAAREVGDATLFASMRVGFAPEVEARRQWLATLQQLWPERIERAWSAARPELPSTPDARAWTAQWAPAGQGGGLRMDEGLDAAQQEAATRLVLLRHRAYGGTPAGAITLADLWPLQNVQGRRLLRSGDLEFARAQARQLLRERFVEDWLRRDSGWSAAELDFVRRVVEARQRKLAWVRWQGLTADPHGDAPAREALAASVTAEEIGAYYRAHLDRFARLEAVDGVRLRCAGTPCGEGTDLRGQPGVVPVAWRLGDPAPVAEVDAWSLDLLRAWPAGAASPPIRHPDGTGWDRVQVMSVRRGHHPADSDTVRHEARQAIAQEKLEAHWRERQRALLASAGLRWAPGLAPPATPFEPDLPMKGAEGHGHGQGHGHAH
ncbi:hypothetical protein [Mitsuaria sp. GD03876]|uniref:hypothetical protein n=1 Tax=Mitsuaria sp. GD03876 TaxID=2975399 RepID=UPI002446AF49|nr:hypothetical protein [Mitsuaria sp. GD03876]MDH0867584.1 hypothetical protein [Mitsuaria sp. GD03876]